jgi:hypothetical protein
MSVAKKIARKTIALFPKNMQQSVYSARINRPLCLEHPINTRHDVIPFPFPKVTVVALYF